MVQPSSFRPSLPSCARFGRQNRIRARTILHEHLRRAFTEPSQGNEERLSIRTTTGSSDSTRTYFRLHRVDPTRQHRTSKCFCQDPHDSLHPVAATRSMARLTISDAIPQPAGTPSFYSAWEDDISMRGCDTILASNSDNQSPGGVHETVFAASMSPFSDRDIRRVFLSELICRCTRWN